MKYNGETIKELRIENSSWRKSLYIRIIQQHDTFLIPIPDSELTGDKLILNPNKNKVVEINNNSATLFFWKTCSFPRYKLQDTSFKRCIKMDKATYVVIPEEAVFANPLTCNLIRKVIILRINGDLYYMTPYSTNNINPRSDAFKKLLREEKFPDATSDVEIVSEENVVILNSLNYLRYLISSGKITKPLITDQQLELEISQKLPELTADDIKMFYDMLNSNNRDNHALALRLLPSYNVFKHPYAVSVLLALTNKNWQYSSIGTATESILTKLNYVKNYYTFPSCLTSVNCAIANEEDKEFAKMLLRDKILETINIEINRIIKRFDFDLFKITVDAKVE